MSKLLRGAFMGPAELEFIPSACSCLQGPSCVNQEAGLQSVHNSSRLWYRSAEQGFPVKSRLENFTIRKSQERLTG